MTRKLDQADVDAVIAHGYDLDRLARHHRERLRDQYAEALNAAVALGWTPPEPAKVVHLKEYMGTEAICCKRDLGSFPGWVYASSDSGDVTCPGMPTDDSAHVEEVTPDV